MGEERIYCYKCGNLLEPASVVYCEWCYEDATEKAKKRGREEGRLEVLKRIAYDYTISYEARREVLRRFGH